MQNDKICSEIVAQFGTTHDEVNILLSEVDILLRALYKIGDEDFNHALQKDIRAKTALAITQAAVGQNPEEILKLLKSKLNSVTYLNLTLSFEPTNEIILRFNNWVKSNLGAGVALKLTTDKSILGGAVVEYKGRIIDATFRSKINSYFQTNYVNF